MDNLISLLKKVANEQGRMEVLYVNNGLLDALFTERFGGVTKLLESIEQSSTAALKTKAGVGIRSALLKLFGLDLKANITAEGKISEQAKTTVEKELTFPLKIRLCEASLEEAGLISDNPPSLPVAPGNFLRLTDRLSTFTREEKEKLREELGEKASWGAIARWDKDQSLTLNSPQVALATRQPSPMVAIVMVQSGLPGSSTYIRYPPPTPAHRSVLAAHHYEAEGVTFLRTYWVVDKYPPPHS